jgi:Ser/Thr protein kinase RdoA (MazF antagonist)
MLSNNITRLLKFKNINFMLHKENKSIILKFTIENICQFNHILSSFSIKTFAYK